MTDRGPLRFYLGVEFLHLDGGIFLSQRQYVSDILNGFGMSDCATTSTPLPEGFKLGVQLESEPVDVTMYRRIIGKQLYLTTTRPDIVYATGILSRYMSNPRKVHMDAARHVLRYLKGTTDFGILYRKGESSVMSG